MTLIKSEGCLITTQALGSTTENIILKVYLMEDRTVLSPGHDDDNTAAAISMQKK